MATRTAKELIAEAKQQIEEVTPKEAQKLIAEEGAVPVDVRDTHELERGHLPGAVHISRGLLEMKVTEHPATRDPAAPLILYCGSGGRCALATKTLHEMGYARVYSLAGGLSAWVEAGLPVELPHAEGDDEE